jgi:NAD(P)-dependent dehydrogenase (short-subunit alcohol dehydrogenase family)
VRGLEKKSIIVFGAGTGIGAATVRRLASEGARVCVADINISAAEAVAAEVIEHGGDAFAVPFDITVEESVTAAVEAVVSRFGGIDGAHINAADNRIILQDTDALDIDISAFDRTLAVNLRGHLFCTRAVLPQVLKSGEGAIVYTSSAAAIAGEPTRPAYAASKGGLNALMRHVAARWGREGVTANCVAPGFTMTPEMAQSEMATQFAETMLAKLPSRRVGRPKDIAGVVAMLLSDDGRWINGQVFNVNGGSRMA